ncbi:MAG: recombination mediator RecR [Patescibacteria group bacterium]
MTKIIPDSVLSLIEEFSRLPGIGPKTASRLTFYLLTKPESDIQRFGQALLDLKKNLKYCECCFNITENSPCEICSSKERKRDEVMIVEEPLDIVALEKTGFRGVYHVLGGVISPIEGIGPENLRISEILEKIKKDEEIEEIILATDPSLEGEATSMYLAQSIKKLDLQDKRKIKVTRIARGLPIGGDLEYADEITLTRAIEGRREY